MKCPACFNNLTEIQVGELKVDACQAGCGGIWFDAFELQRIDEADEPAGVSLLQIKRDPRVTVDLSRKRECPRCDNVKLYRRPYGPKVLVEVDECPGCGGFWLDGGELNQIRELGLAPRRPRPGTRASVTGETLRYLYRLQSAGL